MEGAPAAKERILVVEDEQDIRMTLEYALRGVGYEVEGADRGETAILALDRFNPALVLLDLMLPDMSGLDVCRRLRGNKNREQPAVVILSARGEEIDRVVGFEIGADDYVVKPFSMRELILRIEARLKERGLLKAEQVSGGKINPSLQLGDLRVDETVHRVFIKEREVHVSALEMKVITYLLRAPGRLRTRKELLTEVWGYHPEVSSRTVDTHIKRIRDKLGDAADMLQTVRGVGFRLSQLGEKTADP